MKKVWNCNLLTFAYGKLVADFVERGGRRRKIFARRNGDGVLAVRLLRVLRIKQSAIGKYTSRRRPLKLLFSTSISTLIEG